MLSANFSAADLLQAGKTWEATQVTNMPVEPETWKALKQLCAEILEPVQAKFGRPTITYGFASQTLTRKISRQIAPKLDQHAGCECRQNGKLVCDRGGQAVDFFVPDVSSAALACWVAENLPFDRLYFYGPDKPVHVSFGPQHSGKIVRARRPERGSVQNTTITKQKFADYCRANYSPESTRA